MSSHDAVPIPAGADVFDSDNERLGAVVAAAESYIVVEHGLFFPTDYYIPRAVIASLENGIVLLSVTRSDALAQGWEVKPAGEPTDPVTADTPAG
jgi:hypothetical protein